MQPGYRENCRSKGRMEDVVESYAHDGFVFPISVISEEEAEALRADLEAAEEELADSPDRLALLRSYPDRLLPSFDQLVRNTVLIQHASQILGSDLMVWSAGLFIKEPHSQKIVSWHQDLMYWGLDDAEETTCWVALSPATKESGCMMFVPGSHKRRLVPHIDTFAENNLLSRGQEIAVKVDDSEGVAVELEPGEASMHHGHLFHASGPNTTRDRRIGTAIRYIRPSMRQVSGDKSLVALVAGEDRHGHFKLAGSPRGRLAAEDFELCRLDSDLKRRVLYDGVDSSKGKRY
ncbi:MAG: phytanoyl-CoA dioxygenase family protein [Hyphomicrobiaceae bacterium]